MTLENLTVERIYYLKGSQLALQVVPTTAEGHYQFIYRAALSIYWNPETRSFEDHYERETSPLASFQRMARALEGELGLRLIPSPDLIWDEVQAEDQKAIHDVWR